MTWTAIKVLEKVLEFRSMTSDVNEWNGKPLADNPPRFIRLKRIKALLAAYDLVSKDHNNKGVKRDPDKNVVESFMDGDFIEERDLPQYENIIGTMERYIRPSFKNVPIGMEEVKQFYRHLIFYKTVVRNTLRYGSGILEAPIGVIAAYQITGEINDKIEVLIKSVDHLLAQIISPENMVFEETELIEKYGFPTDNLDKIDDDYM